MELTRNQLPPIVYPDVLSAATGLLCETVDLVRSTALIFVVIGGWSPYLLNSGAIRHPGTHDVDLVFEQGGEAGALAPAMDVLRSHGFLVSAKHDFQMLRVLTVGPEKLVFNVDLMHTAASGGTADLFQEHVSLPIMLSAFAEKTLIQKSIKSKATDFLFDGYSVDHRVSAIYPDGSERNCSVPLMDEVGTLVTKAESMLSEKRQRDAFDIMSACCQARDVDAVVSRLKRLAVDHPAAFEELKSLRRLRSAGRLRTNIAIFWNDAENDNEWGEASRRIDFVLDSAGVPELAES